MENEHIVLSGTELAQQFYPEQAKGGKLEGFSEGSLKSLVSDTRRAIYSACNSGECEGKIISENGRYYLEGEAEDLVRSIGGVVAGILAYPDIIRLPELKLEIAALPKTLIESRLKYGKRQRVIAPVCPDYGKDERFYRSIGSGISLEGQGAIKASRVLSRELIKNGFSADILILVANTETDIPEVMQNTVAGEVALYQSQCEASAQQIREEVGNEVGISVATFTEFMGGEFHERQNYCMAMMKEIMEVDNVFKKRIEHVAEARYSRHFQILGRQENAHELTIRYAAQYMALGSIVREFPEPTILLNYPTPNRQYFNAHNNVHPQLFFGGTHKTIPVLGSIVKR